jgi:hypothetical protein
MAEPLIRAVAETASPLMTPFSIAEAADGASP